MKEPRKYSLIQGYNFEDLPLITTNVTGTGAQTPGLASEVGGGKKLTATYWGRSRLLHEIGKIVILLNFPKKFKKYFALKMKNREKSNSEIEEEVFGFSHA